MVEFFQHKMFCVVDEKIEIGTEENPFFKKLKNSSPEEEYDKFYSLFAFDEIGYHREIKELIKSKKLKGAYGLSLQERKAIREKYYVLDIYGEKMPKSDEKHIFLIKALHNIYFELYRKYSLGMVMYEDITALDGLLFYQEELQAEIDGFQMKSIRIRLKAHIELLRRLRKGYTVKEAVKKVKKRWLNGN